MKTLILAVVAALGLAAGSAYAQPTYQNGNTGDATQNQSYFHYNGGPGGEG
jgi:hypothetical protein